MSLAQVRGYAAALARIRRDALLDAALAARAGMADEKGWKAWLKTLDD